MVATRLAGTLRWLIPVLLVSACSGPLQQPGMSTASSLAANPIETLPGVTILPPIGGTQAVEGSAFDPDVEVAIAVFAMDGGQSVGAPIAHYDVASGSVRVARDHYQVLLSTRSWGQSDGGRVRVELRSWNALADAAACAALPALADGCLGWIDLQLVANKGRRPHEEAPGETLTVVNGQTLPLKLHIAQGSVMIIDPRGGTVSGPDGILLGLTRQADGAPIPVGLERLEPVEVDPTLPLGLLAAGPVYRLNVEGGLSLPPTSPLLVGFPLPPGLEPEDAQVAVRVSGTDATEGGASEPYWLVFPSAFQPGPELLVVRLLAVDAGGTDLVIVRAVNARSTSAATAERSAPNSALQLAPLNTTAGPAFVLRCLMILDPAAVDCDAVRASLTPIFENAAALLDGLGFRPPMLEQGLSCDVTTATCIPEGSYLAAVHGNGDANCASGVLGYYMMQNKLIVICAENGTADRDGTAVHELFHAVQWAYRLPTDEEWLIEGTAELVAGTLTHGFITRDPDRLMQDVLVPLDAAVYRAQDFFTFLIRADRGESLEGLALIRALFEAAEGTTGTGRTIAALQAVLPSTSLGTLLNAYWRFARNQVYEATTSLGYDSFTTTCDRLAGAPASDKIWAGTSDEVLGVSLPPLTSSLVEIYLGDERVRATVETTDPAVRSKFYLEGETDCMDATHEGSSRDYPIVQSGLAYVLISNTDPLQPATATLTVAPVDDDIDVTVRLSGQPSSRAADPLLGGTDWADLPPFDNEGVGCLLKGGGVLLDGMFANATNSSSSFASGSFTQEVTRNGNDFSIRLSAAGAATPPDSRKPTPPNTFPQQHLVSEGSGNAGIAMLISIHNPAGRRVYLRVTFDTSFAGSGDNIIDTFSSGFNGGAHASFVRDPPYLADRSCGFGETERIFDAGTRGYPTYVPAGTRTFGPFTSVMRNYQFFVGLGCSAIATSYYNWFTETISPTSNPAAIACSHEFTLEVLDSP